MGDVAGTEYLAIANGADPTGSTDSAYAIQAAANTYGAAGRGDLELPVGTFLIGSPITVPNGVRIRGAGIGRTILRATFTTGAVLSRTSASAADSIEHIAIENLTIDCVAGPAGAVDGIAIDTSVSSAVVCRDVPIADVEVLNARLGIRSDGNNGSAGPMFNQRTVRDAIFRNCLIGVIASGTYAQHIIDCQFYGCTAAAIGTGGVTPGAPVVNGSGPATLTQIRGCHVEGLGNISGTGTATEHGIYIAASDPIVDDCHIENVSRYALCVVAGEGYGALVHGISVWGAGWSGIYLSGPSGQNGVCSHFSLYNVSQSSTAGTGQQGALLIGSGNWTVTDGWIPTATEAPPLAVTFGWDANDAYTLIQVSRVHCPAPKTGWTYIGGTQTGIIRFTDCDGLNPATHSPVTGGGLTPAVPAASTTITNTTGVDCDVYVSGFTGANVAVNGNPTGVGAGTFFLAAGSTIDLGAYTAAGTWTWVGR